MLQEPLSGGTPLRYGAEGQVALLVLSIPGSWQQEKQSYRNFRAYLIHLRDIRDTEYHKKTNNTQSFFKGGCSQVGGGLFEQRKVFSALLKKEHPFTLPDCLEQLFQNL